MIIIYIEPFNIFAHIYYYFRIYHSNFKARNHQSHTENIDNIIEKCYNILLYYSNDEIIIGSLNK